MLTLQTLTRLPVLALAGLAATAVSANGYTAYACSAITKNGCGSTSDNCYANSPKFDGAVWNAAQGGPLWPSVVQATISSYNPSPVWSASGAWTMIDNVTDTADCGQGCFAQVGYWRWSDCSLQMPPSSRPGTGGTCGVDNNIHVFTEWTSNSGAAQPIFYYNVPSSSEAYQVSRLSTGGYNFYWYEGSASAPTTVTWGPSGIQNSEEVHDVDSPTGTGNSWGSQLPGSYSSPVQFSSMDWIDQNNGVHTPSQTIVNQGYGVTDAANGSTVYGAFRAYDIRCP